MQLIGKGYPVDVVYLNFKEAFDFVLAMSLVRVLVIYCDVLWFIVSGCLIVLFL